MWDWFPLIDPDFILSVLTKAQWGGWSDSGFDDPTYDKLYLAQGLAIEPAKRLEIVHQMQQIAFDERPYIILNYNQVIDAWSNDWVGFDDHESVLGLFNNLSKAPFSRSTRPEAARDPRRSRMHRADYVIKRLAFAIMTVFVAITVNFLLFHALPGNAVSGFIRAAPRLAGAPRRAHARVRAGQAAVEQYALYLKELVFHAQHGRVVHRLAARDIDTLAAS